ncbi:type I-E CRISPR-associated protein Cas5/CasD [Pseudonocardia adelaidensis]|uniref:Type I-E CRISPR-associated protein Cas5/CasD n=1 Tax=Pseudonocardia adelaidensis TaxID=648754 RepID=A0ABP9NIH0_9PSEU
MTALLLRLAAPLQSWGTRSRFTRRATDRTPSKSAVIGLLAAAEGIRRTESIEHLLDLTFAVRTEQPGQVERDFQTAARPGERTPVSVSTRHYLSDAVFLASVEGHTGLLEGLLEAVRRPHFPLFLGRRSCPPVGPVAVGLRDATALGALGVEPWRASLAVQRAHRDAQVELPVAADCTADTADAELVRDQPVAHGFDPAHRQWEWRSVQRSYVTVTNPAFRGITAPPADTHDPMDVL